MQNPKSAAREYCVQFLYQCESERLFHFSEGHYKSLVAHSTVPKDVRPRLRSLSEGTFTGLDRIDEKIQAAAANWSLARMAATDRNVLRLATFELLEGEPPPKVVFNEAIELARKFGTAESAGFVNGLLDKLLQRDENDQANRTA